MTDMPSGKTAKPTILAFGLDAALVVAFSATGRASHGMDIFAGLWATAWPFLVALIVGWVVALAWQAPLAPVRTGVPVWGITVAGGTLLRWANGQGIQPVFVLVAAAILLVLLVGWRLIATLITKRSR